MNSITNYKQWDVIEVPSNKKTDNDDGDDTYKKIAVVMKEVKVAEVFDELQQLFAKVKGHQNAKRIKAAQFQKDLTDPSVKVLQIDYAMAYQCELQNETMGALWARGGINLFTCAICRHFTAILFYQMMELSQR